MLGTCLQTEAGHFYFRGSVRQVFSVYVGREFVVTTGVRVMGFAELAEERCVKFSHGCFVVINPDILFVELFECGFLENAK